MTDTSERKPEIGKCSRCKRIMTLSEFAEHTCFAKSLAPIADVKEIAIEHFYVTKQGGREMVMARGSDGVFYRLVCGHSSFIPIILSDDGYHEPRNRRKVNRT